MTRRTIRLGSALPLVLLLLGGALWPSPAVAQTVLTVTKLADTNDGACNADCSLREAVAAAASGDTVTFAPGLTGTITLTLSCLVIDKNLSIQGPGAGQLSISSYFPSRIPSAIVNNGGNLTLINLTVSGNWSGTVNANGYGAAIFNGSGSLTIINSTFNHNVVEWGGLGGAIFNGGTLTISDSTFSNNFVFRRGGSGGAIFNSRNGTVTITNSTFRENLAFPGYPVGGGAIDNYGRLTITNSTFSGNFASYTGGAINNRSGLVTITNSTFSGNSAGYYGGAIFNWATFNEGGMSLGNTVIAGNAAYVVTSDIFNAGFLDSRGHNLVGLSVGGGVTNGVNGDQVGRDPLLGPLANNGGPTATHALLLGSPAIDAGDNTICAAAVGPPTYGAGSLDQRGMARSQSAPCDIGAFEVPPSDVTPPEITPTITGTSGNNGWYTSDVQVSWSVTDPDSAISTSSGCGSSTVSSDTNGTAFTCSATSAGGPASESVTVARDATRPTITSSRSPDANANGWNTTDVTVSFACADNLSGIATCASDITLSGDGASQSVTGNNATDVAGNMAPATVSNINIDKTAPTITASRTPANSAGWNNGDVTVTFTCSDPVSGLAGPCPSPEIVTAEGAGQSRSSGPVLDLAGNSAPPLIVSDINIDKTAPVITGARTPLANAAGWNNTDVTVSFICVDALSGIESCGPTPQVVSTEGSAQSRTATAVDKAGNEASAGVGGINIDKTAPALSLPASFEVGASSPTGATVTYVASATDLVAGSIAVSCTPASGSFFEVGATTVTCMSSDAAGNAASEAFTVTVLSASSQIENTIEDIIAGDYGNQGGFASTLQSALNQLASGNTNAACGSLGAFENQVQARIGKTLTAAQGAELIEAANQMQAASGCN